MADMLALSWDRRRLSGIEFSPSANGPRVLRAFSVDWPEQPPTANWLREALGRFGISSKKVILAIPREDVVLRLLELPDVSDDEMPTLVRFQAAARTAQPLDQLLLDYLPLPLRAGVAQKEVWLATALLTTVDPIRLLLNESGLELTELTLSSLCLTELIARAEANKSLDANGASLIVFRDGARMELAVVCQRQLIAAHAVKWSSVNEIPPVAKMLAEVSRVLVQVQAWLPEGTLQRAWIIGEDEDVGELPDAVSTRWNCPVERLDPWHECQISLPPSKLDGAPSDFATVAGLTLIESGAITPKLDLLHPRQPPPKRDPRKPYIAAAAAAALFVAAIGAAIFQQTLAGYDQEILAKQNEVAELTKWIDSRKSLEKSAATISDWQSRNIGQLELLTELYQVMHGTKRTVIGEYRFNTASGNALAKVTMVGKARDRKDFEQLAQSLDDLPKFKVPPTGEQKSTDPEYPSRFELGMELISVKKNSTTSKMPGSKPTTTTSDESK